MGRTDGQAELAGDDDGDGGRHGDAECANLVQLGDFRANGADQPGAEQGEADGDADGADHHHPQRYVRRSFDAAAAQHVGDCGQRADRVGHVVGAMGEAEQGGGKDQRHGEHGVDPGFVGVGGGVADARLPLDARFHQPENDDSHRQAGQGGGGKVHIEDGPDAFQHQVGGEGPGHEGHQQGNDPSGGRHHVVLVGNAALDEVKKGGRDNAAQEGRNYPTGGDVAHRAPVGHPPAASGHAGTEHAADDGMRCRHGRADGGGDVEPDRAGQQRGHHQPDENIGVGHAVLADDAATNRLHHVTAGDQRPRGLTNCRNEQGAGHGQRPRADRRTDVVGNIVGADVDGHVAADHGGHDQQKAAAAACPGVEHDADDEQQRDAKAEHLATRLERGAFDIVEIGEFHGLWEKKIARIIAPYRRQAYRWGEFRAARRCRDVNAL